MKIILAPILCLFLIAAGTVSNERAVKDVTEQIIAGQALPENILDRQVDHPKFPDLDNAIASAKGCKVLILDKLTDGNYGVQWKCRGRKQKDQPSAMLIYVKKG